MVSLISWFRFTDFLRKKPGFTFASIYFLYGQNGLKLPQPEFLKQWKRKQNPILKTQIWRGTVFPTILANTQHADACENILHPSISPRPQTASVRFTGISPHCKLHSGNSYTDAALTRVLSLSPNRTRVSTMYAMYHLAYGIQVWHVSVSCWPVMCMH